LASPPSNTRALLLELLHALAERPLAREEIAGSFPGVAIDALEAEGLVWFRHGAYRATPRGRDALISRGRMAVGQTDAIAILFTELVSSSELIETLGERPAHDLRARHFALLREAISSSRGVEVKSLGDGLMVVFDEPTASLSCARAMQRATISHPDCLSMRIGIDVGRPVRDGDDYFGGPVIVAKRLCDAADGGEILISDRLRSLIDHNRCGPLRSRGALVLKGFTRPVTASVVGA
jgi:class 3 adenylate cyclase